MLAAALQVEVSYIECQRLSDRDYVYIWGDGVHFNIRLEEDRQCTLIIIGAHPDGTKALIAVEDGYRESAESRSAVLRDLSRRGMGAPAVAIGDGALGFWAAVRDVWPETRAQRDWVHRIANVLNKLAKRLQPKAKAALKEIMNPPTRDAGERRSRASTTSSPPSTRRPSRRSRVIRSTCSRSSIARPSSGSTSARAIRSSRRSLPSGSGSELRREPAHGSGASRWRSSCSRWRW